MIGGMIGSQLGALAGRFTGEKLGVTIDKSQRELEIALEEYDKAVRATETAIISGTTDEILSANYALIAAERQIEAIRAKRTGYFDNSGGPVPMRVEPPEIPAAVLPQAIADYRETQIAGPRSKAELTGKVSIFVDVKDEKTEVRVKSDSPLFTPTETNTGNRYAASELSP
jgi:hypothetical protein